MVSEEIQEEENSFDRVLEIVGNDGRYQKRFNLFFGYFLLVAVSMPSLNIIMALAVPEHWCHVPGREASNYTVEEWKEITIPRENNSQGVYAYSSCKMYNTTNSGEGTIIDCQYGWDFDQTWYTRTAVTQQNWVCDKKLHVTNVFVFTKIGDFLGTFIFGQLADLIGRKPTFLITVSILFLGRMTSVLTSSYIWIFAFAAMLGNLSTPSVFQSPLTIAMEISKNENRAAVQLFQAMGITSGLCLMPIIFWISRDWIAFMLVTTLPCGLYLFSCKWIVESPRWLAGRHETKRCIKELKKIARTNKKAFSDDIVTILEKTTSSEKATYGFMSLFSSWALAKKTVLLATLWIVIMLLYFTLLMNVNNLGGNPFLNYLFQGLAELPANILAKYFCDKMGRRWSHRYALISTVFCSIGMAFLINNQELILMSSILVIFLKFFITCAFYSINLNSMEMFPTCVRQTGMAFCVISASAFGTLAPYIVYLGVSVNLKYPYVILATIATLGVVTGLFVSETLNKPLPETLEDAKDHDRYRKVFNSVNNYNAVDEVKLSMMENIAK